MKARVVIVGVGLEGLIASWIFRQHPHLDVWAIGSPPVGGHFEAPEALTYPWHSKSLGNLLRELEVVYASFYSRNGILVRGKIEPYPKRLRQIEREEAEQIFQACRVKARLDPKAMNGELKRRSDRKIRCDLPALVSALRAGTNQIVPIDNWKLRPGALHYGSRHLDYDFAVITESLYTIRERVWFKLPAPHATHKHVALVVPRNPKRFCPWDMVLTPYTPGNLVHRVIARGHAYANEIHGDLDEARMLSDLNYLYPAGYDLRSIRSEHGGSPLPLDGLTRWPENVAPLGALAEWRKGVTLDEVVDETYNLMRRWIR